MRFREPSGYTGRLAEEEFLGAVRNPENMPELKKKYEEDGFIKLKDAMQVIKRYQPFENPSDPDPRFANDLHATVAEKLGLDDFENLRFYTAVGTYIDVANGVDAFIELDKDGKTMFTTLDITTNPQKGDSHKADIVFFVPSQGLDPKEDKKAYQEKIEEVSEKVLAAFEKYFRN